MTDERIRDILLMAIAIQLSIVGGIAGESGSPWVLLVFAGVLLTSIVIIKEIVRRVDEYSPSL